MTANKENKFWKMDQDHFIHPYTDFSTFGEQGSQVITRAAGAYVSDSDGKRFLDGMAGLWCVNIGHGRQEMADTIAEQVLKMQYYNPFGHCTNEPASELAAKLAELAPGDLNHVFYGCGGSVANDTAVRLAHLYFNIQGKHKKRKIISRNLGYHGSTYLSAGLTGIQGTKNSLSSVEDIVEYVSSADMYRRQKGAEHLSEPEYCDFLVNEFENRILAIGADKVAAFIAEPMMGAGGVMVPPAGYHPRMKEVCERYDMLYIADEVVTAFGRLGHFFASEDIFGFTPDIICSAKGLTSGYIPLGITMISDGIYDVISKPQCEGGLLSLGYTYSGHPVACAAALKNIEIMERENIPGHVRDVGPQFFAKAKELEKLEIVGNVRGSHFMIGIELVKDKSDKTPFPVKENIAERVFEKCRERGVLVRPVGNILILSPPLILSLEQCEKIIDTLHESITEMTVLLK